MKSPNAGNSRMVVPGGIRTGLSGCTWCSTAALEKVAQQVMEPSPSSDRRACASWLGPWRALAPERLAKFAIGIMTLHKFWPRANDNNQFARVSEWNFPAYVNSCTAQSSG